MRVVVVGAVIGLLTPVRVYPDSVGYLTAGTSFFSGDFAQQYVWFREPLYPLFLRVVVELPAEVSLHVLSISQGIALALGLWLFAAAVGGMGLLRHREVAIYYAFSCVLITGYSGAVLQQTLMVFVAGSLAYCAVRLATSPLERRSLVLAGVTGVCAVLLSSIFLPAVALLPFAVMLAHRQRRSVLPFLSVWGPSAVAMGMWMLVRVANGQPFGLGAAPGLDAANTTDWPLRIQAFLATFGLSPDFYNGVHFNTLSYSNVAIALNVYFGTPSCAQEDLASLRTMPETFLICGSTLAPSLPPGLLQPVTTYALLQVVVGAAALVWAACATSHLRLYGFVLLMTAGPCLPVAVFAADGNSRYGLPVLALSLILTMGLASRAWGRAREWFGRPDDLPRPEEVGPESVESPARR